MLLCCGFQSTPTHTQKLTSKAREDLGSGKACTRSVCGTNTDHTGTAQRCAALRTGWRAATMFRGKHRGWRSKHGRTDRGCSGRARAATAQISWSKAHIWRGSSGKTNNGWGSNSGSGKAQRQGLNGNLAATCTVHLSDPRLHDSHAQAWRRTTTSEHGQRHATGRQGPLR